MSNLPQIGVDIGSASLKVVELASIGKKRWKLLAAASMPTPDGGVIGNQANASAVSAALARIVKEAGVHSKQAVVSLPEEQISSHVVEMPAMSDEEVEQALQWQVEQYIPIPQDQAVWSHKVISKDVKGGGMEVLLVAAAKSLVEAYRSTLEHAGLEVIAIETELMATARAEVPESFPLSVVVDIGAKSTDLGIVRTGELIFARTIPTAGEAFTRAIETTLSMDTSQAEQYKNTYGFSSTQLEGKLLQAMQPVLTTIAAEVKKTIDFYTSKHSGETVKTIVLSGGVASLPDVVSALSAQLGLETIVGNPFDQISMDAAQQKALANQGPFYAVAMGLAKRE